jgi:rubrerythrin
MTELKGSETEKNLLKAFAGESQARNRYTYFASVAKKEGYEQISALFIETADNEKEHAKVFFKHLRESAGEATEIVASYPAGFIGTTQENLKSAADGEKLEWSEIYPDFAEVAEKEGFSKIAKAFRDIASVEVEHEARYRKLLANMLDGNVFKKESEVKWKCRNCGHVHTGLEAPGECPACAHKQKHFELFVEAY